MVFIVPIIAKDRTITYIILPDDYKDKGFFIDDYWDNTYYELKKMNYMKFPEHAPKCKEVGCDCYLSTATLQVLKNGEILIYKRIKEKNLRMTLDYEELPKAFIDWLIYNKKNGLWIKNLFKTERTKQSIEIIGNINILQI